MHFVFASRGPIDNVNKLVKELSSQYLPYNKYFKETGKLEPMRLQMRVCPIQLWDLSYPKEHRDAVLNTLLLGKDGKPVRDTKTWRMKLLDKFVSWTQKICGLKPLGEYKREGIIAMTPPDAVEILAIGEKEDYWCTENNEHVDYEHKTDLSYEGI